ncbi:MAG: cytidylate kinase-like family protein [Verrucomicrobiia bacterium]
MNTVTHNSILGEPRIKIIAVEREYGAGGSVIADRLAARLGWKLLDQSLTDEIATLAHVQQNEAQRCEEHLDPFLYRLAKVFWRGGFETSVSIENLDAFDADRAKELMQSVITEAAAMGNCVLMGRGAPWYLRDRADTLNVFLFAPRSFKIQRVLARVHQEAEANRRLDMASRDHAAFLKHYYGVEWQARHLFHLMLNTSVGFDLVVDAICQFKAALDKQGTKCLATN